MKFGMFITIVLVLFSNSDLHAQSKTAPSQIKWTTFDAGMENAKSTHKKILVDVFTDWCGWCKKMDSEVYADPKVKEYLAKNFVIVKMNAEGSGALHYKGQEYTPPQLAAAFGVTGYPATLFLKEDSEPITLLPGYMEPSMFLHVLSFIAENEYEKKQFDDYLKEKGVSR